MHYHYIATNHKDGIAAYVYDSSLKCGGYAVMLKDEDSGNAVGSTHGYKTLDKAIEQAKLLIA